RVFRRRALDDNDATRSSAGTGLKIRQQPHRSVGRRIDGVLQRNSCWSTAEVWLRDWKRNPLVERNGFAWECNAGGNRRDVRHAARDDRVGDVPQAEWRLRRGSTLARIVYPAPQA